MEAIMSSGLLILFNILHIISEIVKTNMWSFAFYQY